MKGCINLKCHDAVMKIGTSAKMIPVKSAESLLPVVTKSDFTKSKSYEQNIVKTLQRFQNGDFGPTSVKRSGENFVCENLKTFGVYKFEKFEFRRRVTSLCWHPTKPNILALGSKGGELVFTKFKNFYNEVKHINYFHGIGPGGSITNICFDPFFPNSVFLSSIDGTVKRWDYETHASVELLKTGNFDKWYCSVSASEDTGLVVAGDTSGVLMLIDKEMKVISGYKLHRNKINTAEFSKTRGWLLATASLDNTVKIWDIRKITSKQYLEKLDHERPVNSAYFSKTNCDRLLTTDQNCKLRVYSTVNFGLETLIYHPHRQFQHLTPIKASWHPLTDLIVVGRYPDPTWPNYQKELRSVDFISASTGEVKVQLTSFLCKGIFSLNELNATGEVLASGMGVHVPYWKVMRFKEQPARKPERDSSDDEFEGPKPQKRAKQQPRSKTQQEGKTKQRGKTS